MHDIKEVPTPTIPGSTRIVCNKNFEKDQGWREVHVLIESLHDCISIFFWRLGMLQDG